VYTRASDIYAFGVVILQVLTTKGKVQAKLQSRHFDYEAEWPEEVAQIIAQTGEQCIIHERSERPEISDIICAVSDVIDLSPEATGIDSMQCGNASTGDDEKRLWEAKAWGEGPPKADSVRKGGERSFRKGREKVAPRAEGEACHGH